MPKLQALNPKPQTANPRWEYSWDVHGAEFLLPDEQGAVLRVASGGEDHPSASPRALSKSPQPMRPKSMEGTPAVRTWAAPPRIGGRRGEALKGSGPLIGEIREPRIGRLAGLSVRPAHGERGFAWRGGAEEGGTKEMLLLRHLGDQVKGPPLPLPLA